MKKYEKLLQKINPKDRRLVLEGVDLLFAGQIAALDIVKISDNKYRMRRGRYRILFRYLRSGEPDILAIRRRGENTYRDI